MNATFKLEHSEFYKIFDPWRKNQPKDFPKNGVYVVKSNLIVERCLGPDPDGILYIGQGNILSYNNRVGKLVNSFNGGLNVHEAGTRYLQNEKLRLKFPISSLILEITLPDNHKEMEKDLLKKYLMEFGDIPPLNRIGY
ncbi:MAG: hypothetical protein HWD85_07720 [Flavobacteriaceae bacterium]|nr:hypothetical protein [Flavobacteriaceae bacterium]